MENVVISHCAVIGENLLARLAGINGLEDIIRFLFHFKSPTPAGVRQSGALAFAALGMPSFRRFDAGSLRTTPDWTPEPRWGLMGKSQTSETK